MRFTSEFEKQLARDAGIVDLMADLGDALNVNPDILLLGGGNPAHIPEFEAVISECLQEIAQDKDALHKLIGVYQSPQGSESMTGLLAEYLREQSWPVTEKNICITHGSQSAFFMLLNVLAGKSGEGRDGTLDENSAETKSKKIYFPILPEYLGYADQGLSDDMFEGGLPKINKTGPHEFKYGIDFDNLNINEHTAALCVSRPSNPTGNVITDEEVACLGKIADQNSIPLIIDCAYGNPFPGVMFCDASLVWQSNRIIVLSLSKLGLPGVRTGIVIADEAMIKTLARVSTVMSLSNGNMGPALLSRLLERKQLTALCHKTILPFYERKRALALRLIEECFEGLRYRVHKSEGAFFLWLWFEGLPISSQALYERLKSKNVLVMDGQHFFFGHQETWSHARECIRITFCAEDSILEQAINIIAGELRSIYKASELEHFSL